MRCGLRSPHHRQPVRRRHKARNHQQPRHEPVQLPDRHRVPLRVQVVEHRGRHPNEPDRRLCAACGDRQRRADRERYARARAAGRPYGGKTPSRPPSRPPSHAQPSARAPGRRTLHRLRRRFARRGRIELRGLPRGAPGPAALHPLRGPADVRGFKVRTAPGVRTNGPTMCAACRCIRRASPSASWPPASRSGFGSVGRTSCTACRSRGCRSMTLKSSTSTRRCSRNSPD